jgi:hypothetical protein
MEKEFTVGDAIMIQKNQLLNWKKILTPEAYGDLVAHAEKNNKTAKNPNQITRGGELDVFLFNYASQVKPIDKDAPMTKMTADDFRRLRFGDYVYFGYGSKFRSLRYVGRMPSAENCYFIFSDGEYLNHLYIGKDDNFMGSWFMGKYDTKVMGEFMKDYHNEQIKMIERVYLSED